MSNGNNGISANTWSYNNFNCAMWMQNKSKRITPIEEWSKEILYQSTIPKNVVPFMGPTWVHVNRGEGCRYNGIHMDISCGKITPSSDPKLFEGNVLIQ